MVFNVNTKKAFQVEVYTHLLLNLMFSEMIPWGHTSGSRNQGKSLICSATWTRLVRVHGSQLLMLNQTGRKWMRKEREWHGASQKCGIISLHLISPGISCCGEDLGETATFCCWVEWRLSNSARAGSVIRRGFFCAQVRGQLYAALVPWAQGD